MLLLYNNNSNNNDNNSSDSVLHAKILHVVNTHPLLKVALQWLRVFLVWERQEDE